MFDLAINMAKSTDIYVASQTPNSIEKQKGGASYGKTKRTKNTTI